MNKTYNILFVARDDGGCGFFRCQQPATFLNRAGLAEAHHVLRNPTPEQLMNADLVIMQDSGSVESANMAKFMMQNNIPFMTEYDDFVHHVSPHNLGGYGAWNPSTLFLHRSMEMTKKAVGMTVSTPQLGREYFPYNNNIFIVPNYLDQDVWGNQPLVKKNDDKIRIGWCGGNAHADDLKMISLVLEKIVKKYNGKVIFETMGMTRKELAGVFPMPAHNDLCPSCGFEGELHHYPGESLTDYPIAVASKGWDIALAPVINNSFNNCKSDLKIKEYSALGLPIIASPIVPYVAAAQSGSAVIFADSFDEWYNKIVDLIENPDKRTEIGRKNKEWMSQYWIQDNIYKIFEVYKQVIQMVEPILGTKEYRNKPKKNI
jgi:glycosyltransferase involved in cell wall biosynthesis